MGRVISSYFKGFGQLSDPSTRSVIWSAVRWSALIFVVLFLALYVILKATTFIAIGPLEMIFDFLGQAAAFIITWLLFPAVVTAIGSLMLDRVVDAVEARHYPNLALAPGQSLSEGIMPALKFLGVSVGYNLLILPLFIIPPLWPLIPFIYLALNGYLISREFFELVALRRISVGDANLLRTRYKTPLFIAGVGFAFMMTVPILNVIAPVLATAITVHLFEGWRAKAGFSDKPLKTNSTDMIGR